MKNNTLYNIPENIFFPATWIECALVLTITGTVLLCLREKKLLRKKFKEVEALRSSINLRIQIQQDSSNVVWREIHENIGQGLSLAKLNLSTLDLHQFNSTESKIEEARELIAKAILDLRDLSKLLQPPPDNQVPM